tara:strand:- start:322 stop:603 length:282 start_codon:yes stop_codon:yes gene_type:complete
MRKPNYYNQALHTLQQLHISYPQYNMGRHLATALDEYGDVWGITDKELAFTLNKYKSQLDMDIQRYEEKEIDKIIKQGMDLDNILKEEDSGDY